jgi:hypothetical protein
MRGPAFVDALPRCASFVASASITAAPIAVRARLRLQLANVLAALFAEPGEQIEATERWARRTHGRHPLLPFAPTDGVARFEALVAAVGRARARDWDDFALLGRTGAGAVLVPIVLAAPADLPWHDVESAQLAAVEVGARFGIGSLFGPHPGSLRGQFVDDAAGIGTIVGAAAAARILGLDPMRAREALALAMLQPQVAPVAHATGPLHAASEVVSGVLAAELAFDGVRSAPRSTVEPAPFGLGRIWLSTTIHCKEHPGSAVAQSAIDAAREVTAQAQALRRRPLVDADVTEIDVETTLLGAARTQRDGLAAAVARTILPHATDAQRVALEARVRIHHAWDLTGELLRRAYALVAPIFPLAQRDLAHGPLRLRRVLADLELAEGAASRGIGALAAEVSKLVLALGRRPPGTADDLDGHALPLATRVHVVLRDGTRLSADRVAPRGGSVEDATTIVRRKLVETAGPHLGARRAERLFAIVTDPGPRLRVSEVLAAMRPRAPRPRSD